jgi:hypothetical protein
VEIQARLIPTQAKGLADQRGNLPSLIGSIQGARTSPDRSGPGGRDPRDGLPSCIHRYNNVHTQALEMSGTSALLPGHRIGKGADDPRGVWDGPAPVARTPGRDHTPPCGTTLHVPRRRGKGTDNPRGIWDGPAPVAGTPGRDYTPPCEATLHVPRRRGRMGSHGFSLLPIRRFGKGADSPRVFPKVWGRARKDLIV